MTFCPAAGRMTFCPAAVHMTFCYSAVRMIFCPVAVRMILCPASLCMTFCFVGRCSSPCGGGAGLGRNRYQVGPWGAVEGAWPSAGRMPAPLGRWVAALGVLCFAPLGSRGPLAEARVAPLG